MKIEAPGGLPARFTLRKTHRPIDAGAPKIALLQPMELPESATERSLLLGFADDQGRWLEPGQFLLDLVEHPDIALRITTTHLADLHQDPGSAEGQHLVLRLPALPPGSTHVDATLIDRSLALPTVRFGWRLTSHAGGPIALDLREAAHFEPFGQRDLALSVLAALDRPVELIVAVVAPSRAYKLSGTYRNPERK